MELLLGAGAWVREMGSVDLQYNHIQPVLFRHHKATNFPRVARWNSITSCLGMFFRWIAERCSETFGLRFGWDVFQVLDLWVEVSSI